MTKYKVAELDGALLDAAVASALGLKWSWGDDGTLQKRPVVLVEHRYASGMPYDEQFRPSAWWSDGGPLIERERIQNDGDLAAAMRALVSRKLGDEVNV